MRTRALPLRTLPLLLVLPLLLGGCTLMADWFCWDVRVELHLDASPVEVWKSSVLSVSVILLGKDEPVVNSVPEFEDKAALVDWFTDRNTPELRSLRAQGRAVDLELPIGRTSGLQQVVRLSRGDLELDGCQVIVVANFATGELDGQRLAIGLSDACHVAVRLNADGTIEDVTHEVVRD
ncbi:MAG: hypothetical protein H6825_06490 [Planctomycetes bacterium]|nr:hypothetical protein [Planctomycetota bacterium]